MLKKEARPIPECASCGELDDLEVYGDGHWCGHCRDRHKQGRDAFTRIARTEGIAKGLLATGAMERANGMTEVAIAHENDAARFADKADALVAEAMAESPAIERETVPKRRGKLRNTLASPTVAALDASAARLSLLDHPGVDCVAMAVDAADTACAATSLEKMLAHQLGVAHKVCLDLVGRGTFMTDPIEKGRTLGLAVRFMSAFQTGLLTLQKVQGGVDQRIQVQHITVNGQAVVGDIAGGGGQRD